MVIARGDEDEDFLAFERRGGIEQHLGVFERPRDRAGDLVDSEPLPEHDLEARVHGILRHELHVAAAQLERRFGESDEPFVRRDRPGQEGLLAGALEEQIRSRARRRDVVPDRNAARRPHVDVELQRVERRVAEREQAERQLGPAARRQGDVLQVVGPGDVHGSAEDQVPWRAAEAEVHFPAGAHLRLAHEERAGGIEADVHAFEPEAADVPGKTSAHLAACVKGLVVHLRRELLEPEDPTLEAQLRARIGDRGRAVQTLHDGVEQESRPR
jgi:hypothetical protein